MPNIYSRTSSGARCLSRCSGRGGRGRLCNGGRSGLVSDGSREFSQMMGERKLISGQALMLLVRNVSLRKKKSAWSEWERAASFSDIPHHNLYNMW